MSASDRRMEHIGSPRRSTLSCADSMGLHRVENASHSSPAVSLHLYSPPFETCRTFDQRTGTARTVAVKFWSEYGRRAAPAAASHDVARLRQRRYRLAAATTSGELPTDGQTDRRHARSIYVYACRAKNLKHIVRSRAQSVYF